MKGKDTINYTELYNWLWKRYHEERENCDKIKPDTPEKEEEKFACLVASNTFFEVVEKIIEMEHTED